MKQKVINLKGDKRKVFIKLIASQYGVYSDMELKLLTFLVERDMFTPFHLDPILKSILVKESGINENTFITSMGRLIKRGCIARNNKSYFLSVAFRDLENIDLISFKCS
jgi:hypothetical protein